MGYLELLSMASYGLTSRSLYYWHRQLSSHSILFRGLGSVEIQTERERLDTLASRLPCCAYRAAVDNMQSGIVTAIYASND